MFNFIFQQLRLRPFQSCTRVVVTAAVIAEILLLEGFLSGLYAQLRSAVNDRGGDLIVTQAGTANFIASRSILPQLTRLEVEAVEGVRAAHPLTGISAIYEQGGRRTPIMMLVYDTAGGPTRLVAGSPIAEPRDIVIDKSLAVKYGLRRGDSMSIAEFDFKVAGVSTRSSALLTPFVFITYDDLIDFYLDSDIGADIATFPLLSFLIVELIPAASGSAVRAEIEKKVSSVDVFTSAELAALDESLGRQMLGPILGLLLHLSYVIGGLVIMMFMFVEVRRRMGEFAVLSAVGFPLPRLCSISFLEALVLTLAALPLGALLADLIAEIIENLAPVYLIRTMDPGALSKTAAAAIVFSVIGSLLPMRRIARIDPAVAFRIS